MAMLKNSRSQFWINFQFQFKQYRYLIRRLGTTSGTETYELVAGAKRVKLVNNAPVMSSREIKNLPWKWHVADGIKNDQFKDKIVKALEIHLKEERA